MDVSGKGQKWIPICDHVETLTLNAIIKTLKPIHN